MHEEGDAGRSDEVRQPLQDESRRLFQHERPPGFVDRGRATAYSYGQMNFKHLFEAER